MTLTDKLLIVEVGLLVALAFGVLGLLGIVRVPLVTSRKVRIKDIALNDEGWPERARQLSNAFDNQFQLPVLFYVAAILTLITGRRRVARGDRSAGCSSSSRYVHAAIHVTDNNVPRRFVAYSVGFFVLVAYWLVLAVRLWCSHEARRTPRRRDRGARRRSRRATGRCPRR